MKKVKDHLNEQRIWDIFTVSEDSDLFEASKLMYKNKIGALMISKAGSSSNLSKSSVVGILTPLDELDGTTVGTFGFASTIMKPHLGILSCLIHLDFLHNLYYILRI